MSLQVETAASPRHAQGAKDGGCVVSCPRAPSYDQRPQARMLRLPGCQVSGFVCLLFLYFRKAFCHWSPGASRGCCYMETGEHFFQSTFSACTRATGTPGDGASWCRGRGGYHLGGEELRWPGGGGALLRSSSGAGSAPSLRWAATQLLA